MIKLYAMMMEFCWNIEDVLDIFWLNNTLDISSYWEDKYWVEVDKNKEKDFTIEVWNNKKKVWIDDKLVYETDEFLTKRFLERQ